MSVSAESEAMPAINSRVQAARLAVRLTIATVLDIISIARADRHVLDTLLVCTITQSNIAPVNQQGDLQVAYAGADEAPPDEIRRPISINALATSLGLPFETVRRRVKGLVTSGICVLRDGGLIVPTEALSSPGHVENLAAIYERLRAFYYDMRDLGLTGQLPPATVRHDPDALPLRTTARLVTEFNLRLVDRLMHHLGDAVNVLIILETFRSNTEAFKRDLQGGDSYDAADLIPDRLRAPIRNAALAQKLGLPQETVRRHVEELIKAGKIQRIQGGLIVPAEAMAQPALRAGLAESLANLQRLFASMSQLGVLDLWDGLNPPRVQAEPVTARQSA